VVAIPLGGCDTIQRPRTHTWKGRTHELIGEIGDFWEWRLAAACHDHDSELFFAPEGERPMARIQRERAAKAVCSECPVRPECADFALAHYEPFGVWGGLSERDREFIWRRERATALAP
jgi:WhiB family redox-sensing transcriptional regulator